MKFINIYPVKNMKKYVSQDMNMFLTHLVLKDEEYRKVANTHPGYKILDNSLIEMGGVAMDFAQVLEAAKLINADEVVLPDVFMNGKETKRIVNETLKEYAYDLTNYKVMAVLHGETLKEVRELYSYYNSIDAIDVIGIPKVYTKQFRPYGRRPFVVNSLLNDDSLPHNKEIHLLGIWEDLEELSEYNCLDKIRSVDTSLACLFDLLDYPLEGFREYYLKIDLEADKMERFTISEAAPKYLARLMGRE